MSAPSDEALTFLAEFHEAYGQDSFFKDYFNAKARDRDLTATVVGRHYDKLVGKEGWRKADFVVGLVRTFEADKSPTLVQIRRGFESWLTTPEFHAQLQEWVAADKVPSQFKHLVPAAAESHATP